MDPDELDRRRAYASQLDLAARSGRDRVELTLSDGERGMFRRTHARGVQVAVTRLSPADRAGELIFAEYKAVPAAATLYPSDAPFVAATAVSAFFESGAWQTLGWDPVPDVVLLADQLEAVHVSQGWSRLALPSLRPVGQPGDTRYLQRGDEYRILSIVGNDGRNMVMLGRGPGTREFIEQVRSANSPPENG